MRGTGKDSFISFETTPQSWLRQSSSPYTGEPFFFFLRGIHGVSKGAKAPFADAPEGGEVALGLGKRNGVRQNK